MQNTYRQSMWPVVPDDLCQSMLDKNLAYWGNDWKIYYIVQLYKNPYDKMPSLQIAANTTDLSQAGIIQVVEGAMARVRLENRRLREYLGAEEAQGLLVANQQNLKDGMLLKQFLQGVVDDLMVAEFVGRHQITMPLAELDQRFTLFVKAFSVPARAGGDGRLPSSRAWVAVPLVLGVVGLTLFLCLCSVLARVF